VKKYLSIIPLSYFILILVWGSTWIAIKVSVGDTPFIMAALRFFLAGLVLVIYQKIRKKRIFPERKHRKVVWALGIGNFFFGYGLTYWGMQYVNSNVTSILWATLPVMIVIFAHRMLENEKINPASIFSLVGSLIGTYFIFDLQAETLDSNATKGMAMIMLSIVAAAYPNVLFKRDGQDLDPFAANAGAMLIGASLLLVIGLIRDPWQTLDLSWVSVSATVYLAIVGSAFGFTLYFWLLGRVTVVKMSYTTFLIPILASIWGWMILGEHLTSSAFLGAVIILLSVSLPELFRSQIGRISKAGPG